jgi:CyaY protein
MDPKSYLQLADRCLAEVSDWLEDFDPDELDYTVADGVVTLQFADGARYVLNRQSAASQMWFAAGARAWHYGWDAQRSQWIDDRDGHPLKQRIAEVVSKKLGREVSLP